MNKMGLSFQGKQLTVFVANNKIQTFKFKPEFWKTFIWHCEVDIFPKFKDIAYVDIWKICTTQNTNIFQVTSV